MEELLVQAILAERAREATRLSLVSDCLRIPAAATGKGALARPARFAAVGWLRQIATSRR
jgi:hypothetical protein